MRGRMKEWSTHWALCPLESFQYLFWDCCYLKLVFTLRLLCVCGCVCHRTTVSVWFKASYSVTFGPGKIECDVKMLYDKGKTEEKWDKTNELTLGVKHRMYAICNYFLFCLLQSPGISKWQMLAGLSAETVLLWCLNVTVL